MSRVERAVILAAGRGQRLGELTRDLPKALLSLGPCTLIERQLAQLQRGGVRRVAVAVGYRNDQLGARLAGFRGLELIWAENRAWATTGSARSLLCAVEALGGEGPLLVAHGDVACADEIMAGCLEPAGPGSATAADRSWRPQTGDEVIVGSRAGRAIGIARGSFPAQVEACGEFVGVSVFEPGFLAAYLDLCASALRAEPTLDYETPLLDHFVRRGPHILRVCYFDGVPWINVNYAADLEAARDLFGSGLPRA
jgi:choline kinase